MYHLSHIGISTVGEKYYSPRTLCLHTVGDHMCPEAVGHNLDIGEDSLGLSWQHSSSDRHHQVLLLHDHA